VAVDGTHVYWANAGTTRSIGRANLDGSGVDQAFIPSADLPANPTGLAVNATHIHYGLSSLGVVVGRVEVDGENVENDFITGGDGGNGVAINGSHVFWTHSFMSNDFIGRANLNGNNAGPFTSGLSDPLGIAVDGTHVYWGNSGTGAIGRVQLNASNPEPAFIPAAASVGSPWGVAVDALSTPNCSATSASTGHATAVAMSLPCTSGGGAPTFSVVSGPAHGTISGLDAAAGTLTYTPEAGFNGTDAFTFAVRNPGGPSNTATATIEVAKAANDFTIGKAKLNKNKGTARLAVDVPGAGSLELSGKKAKPADAQADGPGKVNLPLKAKGNARRKLDEKGKSKVAFEVTFDPVGGDPSSRSGSVKLVKK
jgi:hypothetical protein